MSSSPSAVFSTNTLSLVVIRAMESLYFSKHFLMNFEQICFRKLSKKISRGFFLPWEKPQFSMWTFFISRCLAFQLTSYLVVYCSFLLDKKNYIVKPRILGSQKCPKTLGSFLIIAKEFS